MYMYMLHVFRHNHILHIANRNSVYGKENVYYSLLDYIHSTQLCIDGHKS